MKPKERILETINHNSTDHLAAYLLGLRDCEDKYKDYFKVESYWEVCKNLGVDIFIDAPVYTGENTRISRELALSNNMDMGIDIKDGNIKVFSPEVFGIPNIDSFSMNVFKRPLYSTGTVKEVEKYSWPDPDDFDFLSYRSLIGNFYNDYAILEQGWLPVFSRYLELTGMEEGLMKFYSHPDVVEAIIGHISEFYLGFLNNLIDKCGKYLDFIGLGDDFAGQRGMLISPGLWRKFLKPVYKKLFDRVKEAKLLVWFHSCGSIREVLPDLVDIGLDVWETVQLHLPGNDPKELKKEFGKYITFAGGISTQSTLPFGSPSEVRREVREVAAVLGKNGGYICGPDHTPQEDIPVKNLVALYKEAHRFNL
jgi:uroporphyrinogen decarboxylase